MIDVTFAENLSFIVKGSGIANGVVLYVRSVTKSVVKTSPNKTSLW
jgi:hypothetical protein